MILSVITDSTDFAYRFHEMQSDVAFFLPTRHVDIDWLHNDRFTCRKLPVTVQPQMTALVRLLPFPKPRMNSAKCPKRSLTVLAPEAVIRTQRTPRELWRAAPLTTQLGLSAPKLKWRQSALSRQFYRGNSSPAACVCIVDLIHLTEFEHL